MGRRATFTEAQIKRAMKAAREIDARAVIEVTRDGTIRIMPADERPQPASEVDSWFDGQG